MRKIFLSFVLSLLVFAGSARCVTLRELQQQAVNNRATVDRYLSELAIHTLPGARPSGYLAPAANVPA